MRAIALAILFLAFVVGSMKHKEFDELPEFDKFVISVTLLASFILMALGL